MKKIFYLALVLLLLNCATKKEKVKWIKFGILAEGRELETIYKQIATRYEKENPGIKIETVFYGKPEKLLVEFAGGKSPDVFTLHYTQLPEMVSKEVIAPLDSYIKRDEYKMDEYFPVAVSSYHYKENQYAIPYAGSVGSILYNKDIFQKMGVKEPSQDWDWEDLRNAAIKLTATKEIQNKTYGFLVRSNLDEIIEWIWSGGGDWVSEDLNRSTYTKPATKEALRFYFNLLVKDKVGPSLGAMAEVNPTEMFSVRNSLAMFRGGPWFTPALKPLTQLNWDIAMFPRGSAGRKQRYAGKGYCISKPSKEKEEAWKYIKYLSDSQKGARYLINAASDVPANRFLAQSKAFILDSTPWDERKFVDGIEDARPLQIVRNYSEIKQSFALIFEEYMISGGDFDNAVKKAELEMNTILGN